MSSLLHDLKHQKLDKPEFAVVSIFSSVLGVIVLLITFFILLLRYGLGFILSIVLAIIAFYITTYFYTFISMAILRFLVKLDEK